jgi:WXG100 family type VII secretion target
VSFLRVDFAGAQAIAAKLKSHAADSRSTLASLRTQASPEAVWEGQAAQGYREAYDRWEQAEKNLIEALDGLGVAVKQIIDNFEDIDRRGRAAFPS